MIKQSPKSDDSSYSSTVTEVATVSVELVFQFLLIQKA
jgi:hypothetical protein